MNSLVESAHAFLPYMVELRDQALDMLTDADLAYALPNNPSLGEVMRNMGEIEHSYIQSFKVFTQEWTWKHDDPTIATSVDRLRAWFKDNEKELDAALAAIDPDEVGNKLINRGTFQMPLQMQLDTYTQALFILYGKLSVYLMALGKPLTERWVSWIG